MNPQYSCSKVTHEALERLPFLLLNREEVAEILLRILTTLSDKLLAELIKRADEIWYTKLRMHL